VVSGDLPDDQRQRWFVRPALFQAVSAYPSISPHGGLAELRVLVMTQHNDDRHTHSEQAGE
jgi:hypothetical protein